MKVRVINKPFRGKAVGEEFELKPAQAKVLAHLKRAVIVEDSPQAYQTRMMTAEPVAATPVQYARTAPLEQAPYGYKADGTPRKIAPPKPKAP